MARYRLSRLAAEDLLGIATYGLERFGLEQSLKYRDSLKEQFERIAQNPDRYPPVNHIRKGYRRSVFGVHSIYYRVDSGKLEIVRILGRQDPSKALP